jgi:predicted cupin superfamily sugar epimerase
MFTAAEVIEWLDLALHPEGGHFRETFRDERQVEGRSVATAIYYLLAEGEASHWHMVDAAEIWHHYMGDPLELKIALPGGVTTIILGDDMAARQVKQAVVPAGAWQAARGLGAWSLMGCTVAPGFEFDAFELAPAGWSPEQ